MAVPLHAKVGLHAVQRQAVPRGGVGNDTDLIARNGDDQQVLSIGLQLPANLVTLGCVAQQFGDAGGSDRLQLPVTVAAKITGDDVKLQEGIGQLHVEPRTLQRGVLRQFAQHGIGGARLAIHGQRGGQRRGVAGRRVGVIGGTVCAGQQGGTKPALLQRGADGAGHNAQAHRLTPRV